MSQMQRARNQNPSSLESVNQPLFLSTDVIEYPQDEGNMHILDHGQHHHQHHHHQDHHLFLTPTVISYNNEEEDELLNLDGQFMALEIGAPQDWPQEPYQAYQPDEVMYPCSQHLYCHGYEHYGDEHYDSIGDPIHLHDTPHDPRRLHQRQHQHQHQHQHRS
ncbi:hypothetical protein K457DRAFT_21353 [Linnemannia elongata AG-77]|uniref:Uncharacterized protein n=1 Tax=Linnemannia elongata AG-77 TaxID=1314771 RepID=A0A197JR82_9FUNG|nr:hypothetical protein K457DRAFT_21353 [Linnemannia elongata AG-77]